MSKALVPAAEHLKAQKNRIMAIVPNTADIKLPEKYFWRNLLVLNEQMRRMPKLEAANPDSLLLSFMEICMLGLNMGSQHEACIVPFAGQAQAIFEYPGILKLAYQTGLFKRIRTRVVYEDDIWDYDEGDSETIIHKPQRGVDKTKIVAAYLMANTVMMKEGDKAHREWMWIEDIDAIMKQSKGYQYAKKTNDPSKSPWLVPEHKPEMCRKSVLHRGMKSFPRSPTLAVAFEIEAAFEQGRHAIIDLSVGDENINMPEQPALPESTTGKAATILNAQTGENSDVKSLKHLSDKRETLRACKERLGDKKFDKILNAATYDDIESIQPADLDKIIAECKATLEESK